MGNVTLEGFCLLKINAIKSKNSLYNETCIVRANCTCEGTVSGDFYFDQDTKLWFDERELEPDYDTLEILDLDEVEKITALRDVEVNFSDYEEVKILKVYEDELVEV